MKATNPHKPQSLQRQIKVQKDMHFDFEHDINWRQGIDLNKPFLPLDQDCIAFPGASAEQALALSQLMGLIVNATIAEMEDSLPKLKYAGWELLLRSYPCQPEIRELGELFFEEEMKHARVFNRFCGLFAETLGVDPLDLNSLLPKAYGSFFQQAIMKDAEVGGHAFWWVVASVEEVSIRIYHLMESQRQATDPLFFEIHRKHMEEEARHANYAFLMLNLVKDRPLSFRRWLTKKVDFALAQLVPMPWVLSELGKIHHVKAFKGKHPFFDVLISCLPLIEAMPKRELIKRLYVSAPYISWILNPSWRRMQGRLVDAMGAIQLPFPAHHDDDTPSSESA